MSLQPGIVVVRVLSPDAIPDADVRPAAFLDQEESRRAGAFRAAADRNAFVAAHALLRGLLSDVLRDWPGCLPPQGWSFVTNPHGKPGLAPGPHAFEVRFNLSHCRSLVAVAIAAGSDVGIDVEAIERHAFDDMEIARAHFSAAEQDYLRAIHDGARRKQAFLDLWTAKEAFVKAVGQGLSMPLDSFCVDLHRGRYTQDRLPPEARNRTWTLMRWQMPGHHVSLAAGSPVSPAALRFDCREATWNPGAAAFRSGRDVIPVARTGSIA